ncbi:PP2C family protein-serine/threonine phosphatase [Streptomyces prunicolor]|uniref:PP2C family protein-serine/threonine phosphatase n=1 Tax=Streptomyces prunicolor TaxID=67348 RepID=A0ABU4F7M8_9ACTN|nr:PP2C family protein-serine/threonine phosphatase [Streptomyces prunicolor]MDV7216598.1 PP2C family protein-serine/threonine phosphatase [Streptomyces prunicolor]
MDGGRGFRTARTGSRTAAADSRTAPAGFLAGPLGLLVAPVGCLLAATPGLLIGRVQPILPLLAIGPLMAATFLGARRTFFVSCWTVLLALAAGLGAGTQLSAGFAVRWGGLLLGCACSVYAAWQRGRLRERLAEAREVARITQEAILRPVSRTLSGTHVSTRYHCAGRESSVGGDLYDLAVTPYGLRVLVGDARGHGLDALRTASDTVTAFRELAYTTPDLTALARKLDVRLAPRLAPEDFVTAVLAEFGPGEVRLVNCGHPAPLRSGRRLELLEPRVPALPLGLHPEPHQYRVRLQPGDRLLLYTDGLTESRAPDGTPFALLTESATALGEPTPDAALHALYDRLLAHTGGPPTDDLALVLCQPTGVTAPVRV